MYTSIVVGTDGSPTAAVAVNEAARIAMAFDAPLHVVSAFGTAAPAGALAFAGAGVTSGVAFGDWTLDVRSAVEEQLGEIALRLRGLGLTTEVYAIAGDPVGAILQVAEAEKADLIVVGNKGMQGARRVLGSVPNSVAHRAACTVLIVKTT